MTKSGLADSPFFARPLSEHAPVTSPATEKSQLGRKEGKAVSQPGSSQRANKPRHQATIVPSNRDTTVSRIHDTMMETVRRAVREIGKEAATHRFTPEEKRAVLDIIYSYKGSGIKTSENEVARISINFILEDYKQNGEDSILDQVLRALNE